MKWPTLGLDCFGGGVCNIMATAPGEGKTAVQYTAKKPKYIH